MVRPKWVSAVEPLTRCVLSTPFFASTVEVAAAPDTVRIWEAASRVHRDLPARGQIEVALAIRDAVTPPPNCVPRGEAVQWIEQAAALRHRLHNHLRVRPSNVSASMGSDTAAEATMMECLGQLLSRYEFRSEYFAAQTTGSKALRVRADRCLSAHFLGIFEDLNHDHLATILNVLFQPTKTGSDLRKLLRHHPVEAREPIQRWMTDAEWTEHWERWASQIPKER